MDILVEQLKCKLLSYSNEEKQRNSFNKRKDLVLDLYNKGYSLKYITKELYKYINRNCVDNHYLNGVFIITKKDISMKECYEIVEKIIINNR